MNSQRYHVFIGHMAGLYNIYRHRTTSIPEDYERSLKHFKFMAIAVPFLELVWCGREGYAFGAE